MSKVLWEHHSIEFFFDQQKKISYGSGVKKVTKSKFASVGLKTYGNDIFEIEQFLWVKTPMGVERFEILFSSEISENSCRHPPMVTFLILIFSFTWKNYYVDECQLLSDNYLS